MKVLSIGTDRKLFEESSGVLSRQREYAAKMEELHIVVFSTKKHNLNEKKIGNLYLYPTNSNSSLNYIFDAIRIGKQIVLKNTLSKENSVITTQDPFETGWAGYKLKKKFGLMLQLQIHTDFLDSHFKNSFLNRLRVLMANFLIPKSDGVRVVSSAIKESLVDKFPKLKVPIDILPLFTDVDRIKNVIANPEQLAGQDFPERYVFMNSRFEKEKRFDVALRAMQQVVEKFPQVGLVICGDGSLKPYIEQTAKEFGVKVKLMGWKDMSTLPIFYKLSDIFLLTSEFEGYGLTLVEAAAAGCPIVTTKVGLAKTDLFKNGENSFVCPVGDVECLSKSIINLIEDSEKRKLFKERMQDSIKSMAIPKEEYTDRYVALLEKLLKPKNY